MSEFIADSMIYSIWKYCTMMTNGHRARGKKSSSINATDVFRKAMFPKGETKRKSVTDTPF